MFTLEQAGLVRLDAALARADVDHGGGIHVGAKPLMYAEERQSYIVDVASADGRVEVARLADELNVTPETVRRDLNRLEEQGRLKRVHGGAIPLEPRAGARTGPNDDDQPMAAERDRIAKAAVDFVPAGGAILLDAGTTVGRLAPLLPTDRELTVVTNAIDVAAHLAEAPNITTMIIGGRLHRRLRATVDLWAEDLLRHLSVQVAFVGTNGISAAGGLTAADPTTARMRELVFASAQRIVLLADHTKVGSDHLVRFAGVDDVDVLITDTGIDRTAHDELVAAGVEVVTV